MQIVIRDKCAPETPKTRRKSQRSTKTTQNTRDVMTLDKGRLYVPAIYDIHKGEIKITTINKRQMG